MNASMAAAPPWPLLVAAIRWGSVGPPLLTALAIMGSPGPATISLTAATSAYGPRRSVGYKAWVAIAAVFASARLADAAMTDAAAKLLVLSVMIVLIMGAWLVVGAFLAARLRHPVPARIVNLALAAALVAAAALAILR